MHQQTHTYGFIGTGKDFLNLKIIICIICEQIASYVVRYFNHWLKFRIYKFKIAIEKKFFLSVFFVDFLKAFRTLGSQNLINYMTFLAEKNINSVLKNRYIGCNVIFQVKIFFSRGFYFILKVVTMLKFCNYPRFVRFLYDNLKWFMF